MIRLNQGSFALRTDALALADSGQGQIEASITSVEYQSTHVSVTTRTTDDQEISVLLSDRDFFANARNPGGSVGLT